MQQFPAEVIELKECVPVIVQQAHVIAASIKTQDTRDAAAAWCQDRQREINAVIDRLANGKSLAKAAHQEWCDLENDATEPRQNAIREVKSRIGSYDFEIQRKAREAQQKALAEARREAEAKAQKEAAKLEKRGEPEMAKAALAQAAAYVPPIVDVPKPKNATTRAVWKARLKGVTPQEQRQNMHKFVKFISERSDLVHLLALNVKELEKDAGRYEADCPYAGLEFYPEARVSLSPQARVA